MTRYRLDVDPEGWTVRPRTRQTRKEPTMSIPSEEEARRRHVPPRDVLLPSMSAAWTWDYSVTDTREEQP